MSESATWKPCRDCGHLIVDVDSEWHAHIALENAILLLDEGGMPLSPAVKDYLRKRHCVECAGRVGMRTPLRLALVTGQNEIPEIPHAEPLVYEAIYCGPCHDRGIESVIHAGRCPTCQLTLDG